MATWTSPDGKIKKDIVREGTFGTKPYEGSRCTITITDSPLLEDYTNRVVTIGDNDGDIWRALDICLTTMFIGEKSKFYLNLKYDTIVLFIELVDLIFNGFIYEWDAKKKYDMALHHKEKGIDFFHGKNNKEAAYRFTKALKIISSIPLDVEKLSVIETVDGVALLDINKLKETLYNNLSSCYFRNEVWDMVMKLSKKVLTFDATNVKALYKLGVAYENDKNFEEAHNCFIKVLNLDPENKAAMEQLYAVNQELKKEEIKVNHMVKKMFGGAIKS